MPQATLLVLFVPLIVTDLVLLQSKGVAVSITAVGCPEENGFAERLMRTIKKEHVSLTEYQNINEARSQIGQFLTDV